jgi:hypothetical protein
MAERLSRHAQGLGPGPWAVWISSPSASLGEALATLVCSRLAQSHLGPFPIQAKNAEEAERLSREAGARALLRIRLTVKREQLRAAADALGTRVNFWSGQTPTRPELPAAAFAEEVAVDEAMRPFLETALPRQEPPSEALKPRKGGTLRVAFAKGAGQTASALTDLAHRSLFSAALCHLKTAPEGLQLIPAAAAVRRTDASSIQLVFSPKVSPSAALAWLSDWQRRIASNDEAITSLLRHWDGTFSLSAGQSEGGPVATLKLSAPWPDWEKAACHPALWFPKFEGGAFAYAPASAEKRKQMSAWAGAPFLDAVVPTWASERRATSLLSQKRVDVTLGEGPAPADAPHLFATYLRYSSDRMGPSFAAHADAHLRREDLAHHFAAPPAQPLFGLLPDGPMPQAKSAPPAAPTKSSATLYYDSASGDERRMAERIALKLKEGGLSIVLEGVSPDEKEWRSKSGDFDLMLTSALLSPAPPVALAQLFRLAGVDLHSLDALASLDGEAERYAAARQLAAETKLPLIPLVSQGLSVRTAPGLAGPSLDAQGLPLWSDIFQTE